MPDVNFLDAMFPVLAATTGRVRLASLPTPVVRSRVVHCGQAHDITVKLDNLSGDRYGGNKVRKLEYLFSPRTGKPVDRFATFGTVGSHHALATAIYAKAIGAQCTCFLAHQKDVPSIAPALRMHATLGTEMVRYGGAYRSRIRILRERLWGRNAWVVPAGGSSWVGTLGFVNAALELASQVRDGQLPEPQRVYVATGTMGTAAGLAIGFALAGLRTEVQAVRVSDTSISNEQGMLRLILKTATLMHAFDESVPADLADNVKIRFRHAFFAGGYAHSDSRTDEAIAVANEQLGLGLEATYTGKAMAALLYDLVSARPDAEYLFWNTFNSAALPPTANDAIDMAVIPAEFHRYFD
ncbi:MAG: pyridoxal-phosphate dependent enzyme [Woeseiaceae bacterium]